MPPFNHVWQFLETSYYLALAAERILLSARSGVSDRLKGEIYSAVRHFRCTYEDWLDYKDYEYSDSAVKHDILDALQDLNKINNMLGEGEFVPDELRCILQAMLYMATDNVEKHYVD